MLLLENQTNMPQKHAIVSCQGTILIFSTVRSDAFVSELVNILYFDICRNSYSIKDI